MKSLLVFALAMNVIALVANCFSLYWINTARKAIAAADRLDADIMYKWAPEAKDAYIKARSEMGWH